MSLGVEHLRAVFEHPNVRAFYMVVRRGESSLDDRAYRMISGGGEFDDFSRHPFDGLSTRQGGRAAGAGQFIPSTWSEIAAKWGLEDFTPGSQDLGYVACLEKRRAVDLIRQGKFEAAVAACRLEWTSLPGASENHAAWNMDAARALYLEYGGRLDAEELLQTAAPIEDRSQPSVVVLPEKPQESFMAPIFAALLPTITSMIPQLLAIFGADAESKTAKRNVAAAGVVAQTLIKATESVNLEQAVSKMQTDPEIAAKAKAAVAQEPTISALLEEVGGGIVETRKTWSDPAGLPFWKQGPFYITLALIIVAGAVVASVLTGSAWRPEDRSQVLMLAVSLFSMVGGFWLGSSIGSVRKTDMINQAKGTQ